MTIFPFHAVVWKRYKLWLTDNPEHFKETKNYIENDVVFALIKHFINLILPGKRNQITHFQMKFCKANNESESESKSKYMNKLKYNISMK